MPGSTSTLAIADRIEIQDLLTRYCHVVDDRDWDAFAELFATDAILDFTAFGGPRCDAAAMTGFLRDIARQVHGWQHTISTLLLTVDGVCVRARSAAQVMMITRGDDSADRVSFSGLWYRDQVVRTGDGWKIKERVQERSWVHNAPVG